MHRLYFPIVVLHASRIPSCQHIYVPRTGMCPMQHKTYIRHMQGYPHTPKKTTLLHKIRPAHITCRHTPTHVHLMFLHCTLRVRFKPFSKVEGILFKPGPSLQIRLTPKFLNPIHFDPTWFIQIGLNPSWSNPAHFNRSLFYPDPPSADRLTSWPRSDSSKSWIHALHPSMTRWIHLQPYQTQIWQKKATPKKSIKNP